MRTESQTRAGFPIFPRRERKSLTAWRSGMNRSSLEDGGWRILGCLIRSPSQTSGQPPMEAANNRPGLIGGGGGIRIPRATFAASISSRGRKIADGQCSSDARERLKSTQSKQHCSMTRECAPPVTYAELRPSEQLSTCRQREGM
jgi:hypothetical protein